MIDLHIHTKNSDGTYSLEDILKEANDIGLEVLSITDHDTVKTCEELEKLDYKKLYNGKIIPGMELSTVYDGVAFHMLAYDFDYRKLEKFIYENYKTKKVDLNKEFEYMLNSCRKNNIKIGDVRYDKSMGWPVDIIYSEVIKYEENRKFFKENEWNNKDIFFNIATTNKNFPAFVDFSIHFPSADIVAKAIREAGGKLFLAHVYRYNLEKPLKFIDMLLKEKIIDGVEVEYSSFTKEQSNILKEYCIKNNLLMTGGTDFHGDRKKEIKLGVGYGDLNINKSILNGWNVYLK